MTGQTPIVFFGRIITETAKAVLFLVNDENESTEHWFPRGQIEELTKDSITVSRWIAHEKGLVSWSIAEDDPGDYDYGYEGNAYEGHPGDPSNYGDS